MAFYIQYDEFGNIGATVQTEKDPPICDRQLVFDNPIDTSGKMVDIATLTIINAPPVVIDPAIGV